MDNLKRILHYFYKPVSLLAEACEVAIRKRSEGGYISANNPKGYLHLAQPVDVAKAGRKGDSRPISKKNTEPFFQDLEMVMTGLQEVEGLQEYLHQQAVLNGKKKKSFSWVNMEATVKQHALSVEDYLTQYSADQAEASGKVAAPKPVVVVEEEEEIGF
jgi:hypothetical protein